MQLLTIIIIIITIVTVIVIIVIIVIVVIISIIVSSSIINIIIIVTTTTTTIIIVIIIIISRADFEPTSPKYDDIFVRDAARRRLRKSSVRRWTAKTRSPPDSRTRNWPKGRIYYTPILADIARERLFSQVRMRMAAAARAKAAG